jgi:hypothetical protein
MTTASVAIHKSLVKQWARRIFISFALALVAVILLTIISVSSEVGLGTMVSEKMLGRDGVTNSSLLLGRTGTNTELSVMGFAPVVSTQVQTALSSAGATTSATLQGRVTNMNGMPSATGYFLWGYSATLLPNTTSTVPVTGTGDYDVTITGFSPTNYVYYQFVTSADGTSYGAVSRFLIPSGTGGYLLKNILRTILAAIILIGVIRFGKSPMTMLVLTAVGLVGFAILSAFIDTLF